MLSLRFKVVHSSSGTKISLLSHCISIYFISYVFSIEFQGEKKKEKKKLVFFSQLIEILETIVSKTPKFNLQIKLLQDGDHRIRF